MRILLLTGSMLLSGCMTLSGESAYTVKPIALDNGKIICCEVEVNNTKDYDKLKMKFVIEADGSIKFELNEDGVSASDPAAVQAENNSRLLDAAIQLLPVVKK